MLQLLQTADRQPGVIRFFKPQTSSMGFCDAQDVRLRKPPLLVAFSDVSGFCRSGLGVRRFGSRRRRRQWLGRRQLRRNLWASPSALFRTEDQEQPLEAWEAWEACPPCGAGWAAGHRSWAGKTTGCNDSGMPSWRCGTRRENATAPSALAMAFCRNFLAALDVWWSGRSGDLLAARACASASDVGLELSASGKGHAQKVPLFRDCAP